MSRDIIENTLYALASADAARIEAVFTEDAEWLSPPGNATAVTLGTTDHLRGREAIVRFFTDDFPRLFARDLGVSFGRSVVDGEQAAIEATLTATLPNGEHYSNDYCFVLELRNGLVHRVREYVDTARGYRLTAGVTPPPVSSTRP